MKAYMIFSNAAGSEEGAALVFAHTTREARNIGWHGIGYDLADGQFTDLGVRILRDRPWLFQEADVEKLRNDIAHVIDDPKLCTSCEQWGGSQIGVDDLCEECREEKESELLMRAKMKVAHD